MAVAVKESTGRVWGQGFWWATGSWKGSWNNFPDLLVDAEPVL